MTDDPSRGACGDCGGSKIRDGGMEEGGDPEGGSAGRVIDGEGGASPCVYFCGGWAGWAGGCGARAS